MFAHWAKVRIQRKIILQPTFMMLFLGSCHQSKHWLLKSKGNEAFILWFWQKDCIYHIIIPTTRILRKDIPEFPFKDSPLYSILLLLFFNCLKIRKKFRMYIYKYNHLVWVIFLIRTTFSFFFIFCIMTTKKRKLWLKKKLSFIKPNLNSKKSND